MWCRCGARHSVDKRLFNNCNVLKKAGIPLTNLDSESLICSHNNSDGPFTIEGGRHTSISNEEFDASLRQRNHEWGYRDVEELKKLAQANGLVLEQQVAMPANNFCLVFQARGAGDVIKPRFNSQPTG